MNKNTTNIRTLIRNLLILLAVAIICGLAIYAVKNDYKIREIGSEYGLTRKKSWVGQYLSGYHATQTHDYAKAADFFAKSVKLGKSNEYTQIQTMNLLIVTGKYADAFEIADHLYENNQNILASIVKIIKEVELGNFKSADIIANQLSKNKNASTVLNQVIYAWVKFGNNNYLAAKNILESMQSEHRFLPFINYHYALIAELAGDKPKAKELYTWLAQNKTPPVAMASATYNYFIKHQDIRTANMVAKNYGSNKVKDLAEYHQITNAKLGIAECLADTATIIMTEFKDDSAATFFRLALYLKPDFEEIKLLLATILMNQGDYDGANKLLKSINEKSAIYDSVKLAIAKNYEAMKQSAKAKQYYEKLAESDSTKLQALINLADLKREAENYESAIEYYTKAIEFAQSHKSEANLWPIYFARGVSYERTNQWKKAEADLKQALTLNPEQPDVLNYLGYSLIDNNIDIEGGIKMVARAYELKPEDSHILDSVGWGWYKLGDYEAALRFLEAAITQMPYDPTVNDHLGDVYWRLGRKTEAKYQWQRALDNNPEDKYLDNLKSKLENGLPNEVAKPKKSSSILTQTPIIQSEPEEMEGTE